MWAWQTLWTMRPRGLTVDSVGVVGLKFFTGKDETTHYGKSTKVENGSLAEEADWGSRLASFHGVRETNLISFVGYRSVSSNVWASHEQRPQPHRRSLVRENGNTVH